MKPDTNNMESRLIGGASTASPVNQQVSKAASALDLAMMQHRNIISEVGDLVIELEDRLKSFIKPIPHGEPGDVEQLGESSIVAELTQHTTHVSSIRENLIHIIRNLEV